MPCHNARRHLPASLASVFAQAFDAWELIAVDDGSTDDTLAYLRDQGDARVQVLTQANAGVSAARNAGISASRAPILAFLDADDTWSPNFLQRMHDELTAHPGAVLAYCGWQNVGVRGPAGQPHIPPDIEGSAKHERLFASCQWPVHAALVWREVVLAAGGFDRALKNAEDYAMWLTIAADRPIVRVPEVLSFYHFHGGTQASSQRAQAALQFLQAQSAYLAKHAAFAQSLGGARVRTLTLGPLLRRGYECYWADDLIQARPIFRKVMQCRYGRVSDWRHMLPAMLPLAWHRALVELVRNRPKREQPSQE